MRARSRHGPFVEKIFSSFRCVVAIIVFGILFYVGGEIGKIKALLFLAGFALVFVLLMKFSLH